MIGRKVSFQGVLYFTKLSVYLAGTWPPSAAATKWETTKYHIAWCLSALSMLCFLIAILVSISKYNTDSLVVMNSIAYVGGASNVIFKMIIYRIRFVRTQTSIRQMEDFIKNAKPHEITLCHRYVDRCAKFYIFISALNYMASPIIVCTWLLSRDQALPTNAVYPFPVDAGIGMIVAYIHQVFSCFQCSSGLTIDCQAALLQWFAGARLDILADEIGVVKDVKGLDIFVRKHRKLLAYATDVSDTISYIVLISATTIGIVTIMSCLELCGNLPFHEQILYTTTTLLTSMNLFICAWPAQNLINVCDRLEKAVYNISWIDMSLDMMKNILILLQRCQRPVTVSFRGFLPTLSFAFYASFLSAIFSYFTTLRAAMMSDESNN